MDSGIENERGWLNCKPPLPEDSDPTRWLSGLVIVEGPDGVGKTTLCRNLQRRIPRSHFARFGPADTPDRIFEHFIRDMLYLGGRFGIADRFYLSSMAYGEVFRGKPDMDRETAKAFEHWLRIASPYMFLVLVTAPKEWALSNLQRNRPPTDEEKIYEDPEMWSAVDAAFWKYYQGVGMHKMILDMSRFSPEGAADRVIARMSL
jgi:thymidylate kinase